MSVDSEVSARFVCPALKTSLPTNISWEMVPAAGGTFAKTGKHLSFLGMLSLFWEEGELGSIPKCCLSSWI